MWPWLLGIGQWLIRLVGGWLPIGTKPVSEWAGKIIWAVGIFVVCMLVWNRLTAPTSSMKTGSQKAESICNSYHQEVLRPSFGCASLRVMEYYKDKKAEEVKK